MILEINTFPRCIIAAIILGSFLTFAMIATDAIWHSYKVCLDFNYFHEGKLEYIFIVLGIFISGYVLGKFSKLFII